jgi:hypothetical protein
MNGRSSRNWRMDWLLEDCKHLVQVFNNTKLSHIKRDGNRVVDWVANHEIGLDSDGIVELKWKEKFHS